jgi:ABC-type dipeptide/oligopeptide/nickel transport system ATPase component
VFKGQELMTMAERDIRHVRGNDFSIIFQEPMTSLNPLHTIEKQIGEIVSKLDANGAFPAHLNLQEQGRFAVGYYHQRQDFFTRKDNDKEAK